MPPDPRSTPFTPTRARARRGRRALLTVVPFALVAGLAMPGGAIAQPSPTERELRAQLEKLHTEAEILTERYNKSRVDLKSAQGAERAAAATAAELEKRVAPARAQLARLAATQYMTGGPDVMFATGKPTGLSETAYLSENQARILRDVQPRIEAATRAQAEARERATRVNRAAKDADGAREKARAKVAQVQRELDRVTTTNVKDPRTGLKASIKGSDRPAQMARKAMGKMGSPYVWAASGPSSFDCSGLVVWAYGQVGKSGLPHYTGALYELGEKIDRGSLRSGDLVYFGGSLHHMGIYLSDGMYLHAPRTGDVVKISKLTDRSDYAGANRIA